VLELFKLEAGVNIVHVPYRGTGPMLAAALADEVQVVADPAMTSLPYLQAGKLRPIAIAGAARMAQLPGVPTVIEEGFPKLLSPFWLGAVAPTGTPAAIQ
jgi:tripartite-type tricarboxylate transporter receptor subunit TctC